MDAEACLRLISNLYRQLMEATERATAAEARVAELEASGALKGGERA